MATDVENDEKYSPPGIAMRLTVAGICQKFPTVKNVSTSQLSTWMKQTENQSEDQTNTEQAKPGNLIILDTRPPEEHVIGYIPGSVRVDYKAEPEEILASVPQLQQPGPSTVVCYCSVGYRSSMVAQKVEDWFKKQGTADKKAAYNLWGSIFQWANEGRPMVDGNSQPTIYTHPYNTIFGKLLKKELRKNEL